MTQCAEIAEITDPKLQSRIRARYIREIAAIQSLGFRHFAFTLETLGPFSALSQLLLIPFMLRAKEVLAFPFPLRLGTANVLLTHSEPSSIAFCMGMGVKFFTNFADGSLLISSTLTSHTAFQNSTEHQTNSQIVRTPPCLTLQQAWLSHTTRIQEMEAQGKTVCNIHSLEDYMDISRREDADLLSRTA